MSILTVRAVTGASPDRIAALVELHRKAFPPRLQCADPALYFAEALADERNLNILMEDQAGTVIGYLLGIPQSQVFEELRQWDPQMRDDPERLYLDIIQVSPEQRGKNHALRLFQAVCAEAERRRFFKLSMHARTANGINLYLQRIFAEIRSLRRIENWFGFGEPFDYMEATTVMRRMKDEG